MTTLLLKNPLKKLKILALRSSYFFIFHKAYSCYLPNSYVCPIHNGQNFHPSAYSGPGKMYDNLDSLKRVFNLSAEASSIIRKSELHNMCLALIEERSMWKKCQGRRNIFPPLFLVFWHFKTKRIDSSFPFTTYVPSKGPYFLSIKKPWIFFVR